MSNGMVFAKRRRKVPEVFSREEVAKVPMC